MTSLNANPLIVSRVQVASRLPLFSVRIAAGVLTDVPLGQAKALLQPGAHHADM